MLAEGEELGLNLLPVVRSSRGCSAGPERPFDPAAGADRAEKGPVYANGRYGCPSAIQGQPRAEWTAGAPRVTPDPRASGQDGPPLSGIAFSHRVCQIKDLLPEILDLSRKQQILPTRHRQNGI
jgi:hypothetical protein